MVVLQNWAKYGRGKRKALSSNGEIGTVGGENGKRGYNGNRCELLAVWWYRDPLEPSHPPTSYI